MSDMRRGRIKTGFETSELASLRLKRDGASAALKEGSRINE